MLSPPQDLPRHEHSSQCLVPQSCTSTLVGLKPDLDLATDSICIQQKVMLEQHKR